MRHSVHALQSQLNLRGFGPLVADGVIGPNTEAAIVEFKRSIGLRARPYVGPLTEQALFNTDVLFRDSKKDAAPFWMLEAIRMKGLHEVRNLTALSKWFDKSVSWIDPRDVPWCGAFVATCVRANGGAAPIPDNPLGARNWGRWGVNAPASFGSILTFWRGRRDGWKGHVGFYWGEDEDAYHVLGGNQANAVTVTRISKRRLLKSRWPSGSEHNSRPVLLTNKGTPLSTNES